MAILLTPRTMVAILGRMAALFIGFIRA